MMVVVSALYKFVRIENGIELKKALLSVMEIAGVKGTIIVANEGINGTVCGSREAIDGLKEFLKHDGRFDNLVYKESFTDNEPFKFLKVLLKKEIVTLKLPHVDPTALVGTYVDAQEWNKLIQDPGVTVIDVRNDFEVAMGSFKNAVNPHTKTFSDFPRYVKENLSPTTHPRIAMSCTGGIRCEKASSLMRAMGFSEVYHLKGGVLQYLEDTKKEDSLWQGSCFVFDERIALDHDLKPIA